MKVFVVVVPSCFRLLNVSGGLKAGRGRRDRRGVTYVFDLFDGKICVCRHADFFRLHVYDDK